MSADSNGSRSWKAGESLIHLYTQLTSLISLTSLPKHWFRWPSMIAPKWRGCKASHVVHCIPSTWTNHGRCYRLMCPRVKQKNNKLIWFKKQGWCNNANDKHIFERKLCSPAPGLDLGWFRGTKFRGTGSLEHRWQTTIHDTSLQRQQLCVYMYIYIFFI